MTMKFLNDVRAEINTLFADNNSGLITAALLRQVVTDMVDSLAPPDAYVGSSAATLAFPITTTPQIVPMTGATASNPQPTIISADTGTRQVTQAVVCDGFLTNIVFEATVEAPNLDMISFQVYQNGTPTPWLVQAIGRGAGKPVGVTMLARLIGATGTIDVRAYSDGATSVDFQSSSLIAVLVPTDTPL